ncbi:hypothetical protein Poly30_05780 [Planctomycetes bacterium Poly30]|uniref:Putative zinc-finger domain-containing protein n=1 Tax=Saltatorellus ferox TaxID=2528018 RepID=A0A518ELW8_9BACT|nr:hypothetical protein Poly30_05780 [Planctomycetes bacterium Poly30]
MKHDDHPLDPNSGGPDATMRCERVLELVPTFVDGEASESLSSAVRKHLIECADCRVVVQEEKSLRQWFEPIAGEAGRAEVVVPEGFAARVTAVAFAGSVGDHAVPMPLHTTGSRGDSQVRRGPRLLRSVEGREVSASSTSGERNSLGFLMGLTAVAAVLMVSFTLMLAQDRHLDVGDAPLSADVSPLDESLRELEALNEAEAKALESGSAEAANPAEAAPLDGALTDMEGDSQGSGAGER